MDIRDFQGLTKFKILIPLGYITSFTCAIIGPLYFQVFYSYFCLFVLLYASTKTLILFSIMILVLIKSNKVFKRVIKQRQMPQQQGNRDPSLTPASDILYGFIIPSFRQDIQLLAQTLDVLAAHKRSKGQYLIFMAMQGHQQGSGDKAQQLKKRFQGKFRVFQYTVHQIRQYQQKGKASNVSWCAQHLQPFFESHMIDSQNVFLTILDADSWAPNVYFDLMQQHLAKDIFNKHKFIFQPPQIFTRNNFQVPVFTRVYDCMHSFMHASNLYSIFKITFPLSNYTISYNMIKKIGFWDTCADAIGQDFHTTQKAFWKTGGQIICVPIYAPFNQVNIATGNGYIQDVLARFWQAQRHAQGCSDLAWQFKLLFNNKFRLKNLIVFYQIFEIFMLPAILPWVFLSMNFKSNILYRGTQIPQYLPSPIYQSIIFNILTITSTIGYFIYQIFKRKANKIIYNRKNQGLWRVIQYPLLFVINLFFISVPTFILAAFGSLNKDRQYIVAQKKNAAKS